MNAQSTDSASPEADPGMPPPALPVPDWDILDLEIEADGGETEEAGYGYGV